MQAECKSKQTEFQGLGKSGVVEKIDGGYITSDAGDLLIKGTECRVDILNSKNLCRFKSWHMMIPVLNFHFPTTGRDIL